MGVQHCYTAEHPQLTPRSHEPLRLWDNWGWSELAATFSQKGRSPFSREELGSKRKRAALTGTASDYGSHKLCSLLVSFCFPLQQDRSRSFTLECSMRLRGNNTKSRELVKTSGCHCTKAEPETAVQMFPLRCLLTGVSMCSLLLWPQLLSGFCEQGPYFERTFFFSPKGQEK